MDSICRKTIELAYREDVGKGDITTMATVPRNYRGKAIIVAKSEGVLSGVEAVRYAYGLVSSRVKVAFHVKAGKAFRIGTKIATITGPSQALIKGERLALNLLSHLCGVATATSRYVRETSGTRAKILDTRKTTPGLRALEKQAVKDGGGLNHRMGLYDMILIKDNHIEAAGGIIQALEKVKKARLKVEIEVANNDQLKEALQYWPDVIMLDNYSVRDASRAVKLIRAVRPKIKIEYSGGVTLKKIRAIARTGVDYISVGALTHSVMASDLSMRYIK